MKRKSIDVITKKAIIEKCKNSKVTQVANEYGIARSTIYSILSNGEKIYNSEASDSSKRIKSAKYPIIENMLNVFISKALSLNIPISGVIIKEKGMPCCILVTLKILPFVRATDGLMDLKNDQTYPIHHYAVNPHV
ncbi:hypothetical protein A3Q56_08432 [Intoshia linei]|uniref:HTH psq-type domain-containing protein n=1 Tax=Intoshia linei TaxID=1819745 RepID=A0A177AQR5_9BILA|nr:hypothetical protein A3Q56_08432 [Intoshia linei]